MRKGSMDLPLNHPISIVESNTSIATNTFMTRRDSTGSLSQFMTKDLSARILKEDN